MKLLTNKDIHRFFWQVLVVLTLMLLSAVLFSQMIVQDFKNQILTIIMITHNKNIASAADRVLQISDGVLTDLGGQRE